MSIKATIGQTVTEGNRYVGGETNTIIITVDERTKTIFGDIKEKFINTLQPKIVHVNLVSNPEHTITEEELEQLTANDANNISFNGRIYYLHSKSNDILIYNNYGEDEIFRFLAINTTQSKYQYAEYKIWNSEDIQGEIDRLDKKIDDETTRAIDEENYILDLLLHHVDILSNAIKDEEDRAKDAEATLRDDLQTEETRAKAEENRLQEELNQEIQDRIVDVDTEQARAERAEEVLTIGLNTETQERISEVERLDKLIDNDESGEEPGLVQKLNKEIQDRIDDVNNEKDRAQEAENSLNEAITNEESRALLAEGILQDNITAEQERATQSEEVLQQNIDTEKLRAENAENILQQNINAESERAIIAETQLGNGVSTETQRAQQKETELEKSIEDEIERATTKENDINQALQSHINNKLNPHNVTVSQIHAVSYDVNQNLTQQEKLNAKINLDLEHVVNTGDSDKYKDNGANGSTKKFQVQGAYKLYTELYQEDTDIQSELDQIGSVLGYQRKLDEQSGQYIGKYYNITLSEQTYIKDKYYIKDDNDEYVLATLDSYSDYESGTEFYEYRLEFNYVYELDPNGLVKQTKDLSDNNKLRLDNLENNTTGINVTPEGVIVKDDLTVNGDLVVKGTTTTVEQETIQSKANILVTNSDNNPLVGYTGTAALKGYYKRIDNFNPEDYNAGIYYYFDQTTKEYVLDKSNSYTPGRIYYDIAAEAVGLYDASEDAVVLGEGHYVNGEFRFDDSYVVIHLTEYSYVVGKYYIENGVSYNVIELNSSTYKPNKYYVLVEDEYILDESGQFDETQTYYTKDINYVISNDPFDPNQIYYVKLSQGQHMATRVDSRDLTDGHLIEWDGVSYILKDSGKSIVDLENEHQQEIVARSTADTAINNKIGNVDDARDANTVYGYINGEKFTRWQKDNELREQIVNGLQTLEDKLSDDIADETSRAMLVEEILDDKIETSRQVETELQQNINNESTRAVVVETDLQDQINKLSGGTSESLAEEIERATKRENDIEKNLNDYIEDNDQRVSTVEHNLSLNESITVTAIKYDKVNNVKTLQYKRIDDDSYSNIVDINTLKSDMELNNVTNDRQVVGLAPTIIPPESGESGEGEVVDYNNHIILFDTDGYHIKDSGKTLGDTGKIDTVSVNGVDIPAVNKNVDLPFKPITQQQIDNLFTEPYIENVDDQLF